MRSGEDCGHLFGRFPFDTDQLFRRYKPALTGKRTAEEYFVDSRTSDVRLTYKKQVLLIFAVAKRIYKNNDYNDYVHSVIVYSHNHCVDHSSY